MELQIFINLGSKDFKPTGLKQKGVFYEPPNFLL